MIVRVVTYGAQSLEAGRAWAERRASDLRGVEGVRHVDFIQQEDPPRLGAVIHFNSRRDLQRYKESGPYEQFVQEMRENVIDESQPVRDRVFELLDI